MRMLPLLVCLTLLAIWLLRGGEMSADAILQYAPQNPWLAAGFLILLYAGKSLTVVFPVLVLQLAGGILFPPKTAVVVNLLGIGISYCIPYLIGRSSQEETIGRLAAKYPKVMKIVSAQQKGNFFISYLFRALVGLPEDVISMYLGAIGIPFIPYICASLLSILPSVLMVTLMGTSISDPGSPRFLLSMMGTVLLPALSLGCCWFYRKRKVRKEEDRLHE